VPYEIRKNGRSYEVINSDTGEVHAKHTTKAKAEAQVSLLEGDDNGFKPDRVKYLPNGTKVNIKFVGKRK
jgi:hypothetical protein